VKEKKPSYNDRRQRVYGAKKSFKQEDLAATEKKTGKVGSPPLVSK
jgi:hypothetical protein